MGYFRFDILYHVDLASAQNLHGLQTDPFAFIPYT